LQKGGKRPDVDVVGSYRSLAEKKRGKTGLGIPCPEERRGGGKTLINRLTPPLPHKKVLPFVFDGKGNKRTTLNLSFVSEGGKDASFSFDIGKGGARLLFFFLVRGKRYPLQLCSREKKGGGIRFVTIVSKKEKIEGNRGEGRRFPKRDSKRPAVSEKGREFSYYCQRSFIRFLRKKKESRGFRSMAILLERKKREETGCKSTAYC